MSIIIIALSLIIIHLIVKYYLKYRYSYWSSKGVSGYEGIDYKEFEQPVHKSVLEKWKKYGSIYGYYEFFCKGIVVNEPEIVKDIMIRDFNTFPNHRQIYFGDDSINLNLFNLPGDDNWKRIRSIITPAFTSSKLKAMSQCIEQISDNLILNLRKTIDKPEVEVNLKRYIGSFLIDVMASCAYGMKTDALNHPDQPLVSHANSLFAIEAKLPLIISATLPKVAKFLRLQPFNGISIKYLRQLTENIITERLKKSEEFSNNSTSDFIQLLIEANKGSERENNDEFSGDSIESDKKHNSNQTLSQIEMIAQSVIFLAVGNDTTGSTIFHALYYLSKYQESQEKLYEEICSINEYTNETLVPLKYLNAIINETLRLSPPILKIERVSNQDYVLGKTGIKIPKGTIVTFTPYSLHRDERFFEDPEEFMPQRFIGDVKHDPYAFIPFGFGPRNCLGMRFAMNTIRMCLTKLVKDFRFKLSPNTKLEYFNGNVFLSPKEITLILEKR